MKSPSFPSTIQGNSNIYAIGCLGVLALLAIGAVIAFYVIKGAVSDLVDEYTDTTPRAFSLPALSEEDARPLINRVDAFTDAVRNGEPVDPLVLTGEEINTLIDYYPPWEILSGKMHVVIDDDRILSEVSIPLDMFGPFADGRYLNGSGQVDVEVKDGQLYVGVDRLEVKGAPLPEKFMQELRKGNLADEVNKNPKYAGLIEKIAEIRVENGTLAVIPQNTGDQGRF
jgi:hypothetical protein